jgi:transposase-like protein
MQNSTVLSDWTPPPCPHCNSDEITHKLSVNQKSGWFCDKCNSGPFQLGSMTEQDAAHFAILLLNK